MATKNTVEIRLSGGDIRPENIRAGEMGEILAAIEDTLAAVALERHPKLTKEQLLVGLIGIKRGSVYLQFSSQMPEVVHPAFAKVAKSVKRNEFGGLPTSAVKPLQSFAAFVKRKNCEAQFISSNGKDRLLATLTPETRIVGPGSLLGETTIYAYVVRVGGRQPPKAMIETTDGETVYCDMGSEELARDLGERLYTWVRLKGNAKWDARSLQLEEFRIAEVYPYDRLPTTEAFAKLAEVTGEYISKITDVEGYISQLRGGRRE